MDNQELKDTITENYEEIRGNRKAIKELTIRLDNLNNRVDSGVKDATVLNGLRDNAHEIANLRNSVVQLDAIVALVLKKVNAHVETRLILKENEKNETDE